MAVTNKDILETFKEGEVVEVDGQIKDSKSTSLAVYQKDKQIAVYK
jgi:hypothetical protein